MGTGEGRGKEGKAVQTVFRGYSHKEGASDGADQLLNLSAVFSSSTRQTPLKQRIGLRVVKTEWEGGG